MNEEELEIERLRHEQRAKRREEMKRQKQQQLKMRRRIRIGAIASAIVLCILCGVLLGRNLLKPQEAAGTQTAGGESAVNQDFAAGSESAASPEEASSGIPAAPKLPAADSSLGLGAVSQIAAGEQYLTEYAKDHAAYRTASDLFYEGYQCSITEDTPLITSENVISSYAILLDLDSGSVVAQKAAAERISPASMTKILTLLVAAEHIYNLDDTVTITQEITDYAYSNDCSVAGFAKDEQVTVKDLLYGTVLPSGADAAAALAVYTAGSMEDFVVWMNEKLKELGLSDTAHFTNCVGLYDENHYCTVRDMAMILKAAVENDLCRQVLSEHIYTTSPTKEHPDGIVLSNLFLRRIEDKDTHGEVVCAKTGFVNQSGSCGASYAVSNDGSHYICVTGNAWSPWRCIYDHVAIYQEYTH